MVHEIKQKSIFKLAKQSAKEIGYKTVGAYALMAILFVVITVTFILAQKRQTLVQNASYDATTHTFKETFDGDPTTPQPFTQTNQSNWDVQVHERDRPYSNFDEMDAMHGTDCSAPPASHHTTGSYEDSVFNCKNHLMTAINGGGYGVIYLSPNAMIDFANSGSVQFEMSTAISSNRDWWDVTISPFMDSQALPLLSDLSQGTDLQEPNKNSVVVTTDNGESAPNLKVVTNGSEKSYGNLNNAYKSTGTDVVAGTNQMAVRQTLKLTISKTHVKFERLQSSTAPALIFIDQDIPELSWSEGVIQLGHHSYNPSKACSFDGTCGPNTWHWDTVTINPAIPFSIIKTNTRFVDSNNTTVTFNSPAPANAYLRFGGICKVKVDGVLASKMTDANHPEHFSSYMVPINQGKQSVVVSFADDDWYTTGLGCAASDFAIWSTTTSTFPSTSITITPPTPTSTPLGTTPTPTLLLTTTPTPTNTPTPIPTATPTPTKIPTSTPTKIPTPTPTQTINPTPVPATPTPTTPIGGIPGLTATYFSGTTLSSFALSRVDSTINFNWGSGSPNASMPKDRFSALWTGQLLTPKSDTYTIYSRSDDGVRVYIDNNLIINNWRDHAATENSRKIYLSEGKHQLQVEYYENSGKAVMQLRWSSPSMSKQIISSQYLRTQ